MPIITREEAIEIAGGKTHWMLPEAISRDDRIVPCAERLGEQERTSSFGPKFFESLGSAREHVEKVMYFYGKTEGEREVARKWREDIRPVLQTMRHRFFGVAAKPDYVLEEHKLPPLMNAPIHFGVGQKIYVMEQSGIDNEISITATNIIDVDIRCDFGVMAYGHGKNSYLAKPGVEFSEVGTDSLRLRFEYFAKVYDDFCVRLLTKSFEFNKYKNPEQEGDSALDSANDWAHMGNGIKVFFTMAAVDKYLESADRKFDIAKQRIHDAQINVIPALKEGMHNTHP
jgi:hypothetical protein